MTVAETFAEWALALTAADVPAEVRDAATRHLMDGFGCALGAARTDAAPYATALIDGIDEATVIGSGLRASVPRAALANGILVHALDFDDTHAGALVHATAAVLPTAFALGERTRASGIDVLTAAIAGYEIVARVGAAVAHGFHRRGFHATSVCGVFASALIASKLLGSSPQQSVSALGIAGSAAAGSLEFLETGSATKQLHPGFAAMNGFVAARLAAAGAEGPATIFEGTYGLFRAYLDVSIDPAVLTDGLGSRWETTQITIKPYPACQLLHASLDALRASGAIGADIDSITFEIPSGVSSIVGDKPKPRSAYEAKFSIEHCAAVVASDGDLTIGSFDDATIARVSDLAGRVHWTDRAFDGPPADAPGVCVVRLRDGSLLRGEVTASRGGPDAPLSHDELLTKFVANGGTPDQAQELWLLDRPEPIERIFRA